MPTVPYMFLLLVTILLSSLLYDNKLVLTSSTETSLYFFTLNILKIIDLEEQVVKNIF